MRSAERRNRLDREWQVGELAAWVYPGFAPLLVKVRGVSRGGGWITYRIEAMESDEDSNAGTKFDAATSELFELTDEDWREYRLSDALGFNPISPQRMEWIEARMKSGQAVLATAGKGAAKKFRTVQLPVQIVRIGSTQALPGYTVLEPEIWVKALANGPWATKRSGMREITSGAIFKVASKDRAVVRRTERLQISWSATHDMRKQTTTSCHACPRCGWAGASRDLVRFYGRRVCPECGCEKVEKVRFKPYETY